MVCVIKCLPVTSSQAIYMVLCAMLTATDFEDFRSRIIAWHTCLGEVIGSCVENVSVGRIRKLGEISYHQCPSVECRDYYRMKEVAVLHTGKCLLPCTPSPTLNCTSTPPQTPRFLLQLSLFLLLSLPTLLSTPALLRTSCFMLK